MSVLVNRLPVQPVAPATHTRILIALYSPVFAPLRCPYRYARRAARIQDSGSLVHRNLHVGGRPALDQFSQPVEGVRESVRSGDEAKAKMRRRVETISRREQDAPLRSRLAKRTAVFSAHEPGKRGHSAARGNPADRLLMLGHETAKLPKVLTSYSLCSAEHNIAMAHGEFRQKFAGRVVCDREISARGP